MKYLILFIFVFCSLHADEVKEPIRIGVLADSHGDSVAVRTALQHFRELNVTHLILAGDLVGFFDPESEAVKKQVDEIVLNSKKRNEETEKLTDLYRQLRRIAEKQFEEFWDLVHEFGFSPQKTYFFPGNWDAAYIVHFYSRKMGAQILSYDFRGWTELTVGGHRLVVSHLPIIELPREMINALMDPLTPLNMSLDVPVSEKGDIWIFGHTHHHLIHKNEKGTWIFNPGAAMHVVRGDTAGSYGVIDLEKQAIALYGLDKKLIQEESMLNCKTQLEAVAPK